MAVMHRVLALFVCLQWYKNIEFSLSLSLSEHYLIARGQFKPSITLIPSFSQSAPHTNSEGACEDGCLTVSCTSRGPPIGLRASKRVQKVSYSMSFQTESYLVLLLIPSGSFADWN